jgi:hypothetical protein
MLSRRRTLAAPALLLAPPHPVLSLISGDSLRREAAISLPSGAVFACPPLRARLLATLRMGRLDVPDAVTLVSFGADTGTATQDLLAFVAEDGRLLALERGTWRQSAGGSSSGTLVTRPAMLPDRQHIALSRVLSWHDTRWHAESWTDYLRAADGRLVDAPQRPILEGSGQHRLIALRAAMQALLSPPPASLPADALALAKEAASPLPE